MQQRSTRPKAGPSCTLVELLVVLAFALGLMLPAPVESAEAGKVVVLDHLGAVTGSVLANPKARKLYVGRGHVPRQEEAGIWVHDIFKDGEVTATDERTCQLPASEHAGNFVYVTGFALARDGRKLYLGLAASPNSEKRSVAVQDLDEKGEPTGAMRAHDVKIGFESPHLIAHPKLDCLYAWSERRDTFYAVSLAKGEPTGESTTVSVKDGTVVGLMLSADGGNLFAILSSGLLMVVRLDANGMPEPNPATFPIADAESVTSAARVGKTLFLVVKGGLLSQPLNGDGEPVGKSSVQAVPGVYGVYTPADGTLCLVIDDNRGTTHLVRHQPDAKGQIGPAVFTSEALHGTIDRLVLDDMTGTFYVALGPSF